MSKPDPKTKERDKPKTLLSPKLLELFSEYCQALTHELNNPLSATLMLSEAIQSELELTRPSSDEVKDCAEKIQSNIRRVSEILQRASEVIHFEHQRESAEASVNYILQSALSSTQEKIIGQGVKLYQLPLDIDLMFFCREKELVQVLVHLIHNAVEASFKKTNRWIRYGATKNKDSIRFFVVDSGIGLEKSERRNVFRPFYKVDSNKDSLGLGLTISQMIVESQGGTIGTDQVDGFTRFYFDIPLVA